MVRIMLDPEARRFLLNARVNSGKFALAVGSFHSTCHTIHAPVFWKCFPLSSDQTAMLMEQGD